MDAIGSIILGIAGITGGAIATYEGKKSLIKGYESIKSNKNDEDFIVEMPTEIEQIEE